MLNSGAAATSITATRADLGLVPHTRRRVRDLWTEQEHILGPSLHAKVAPHDAAMLHLQCRAA